MAYINQEKKKEIHEALKGIIPKGWKWSLSIHHHSTLNLLIQAAPVDLMSTLVPSKYEQDTYPLKSADINVYYVRDAFKVEEEVIADLFVSIRDAMMAGNHDNSDIQSDYFDVGWYISIKLGKWDKPFTVI